MHSSWNSRKGPLRAPEVPFYFIFTSQGFYSFQPTPSLFASMVSKKRATAILKLKKTENFIKSLDWLFGCPSLLHLRAGREPGGSPDFGESRQDNATRPGDADSPDLQTRSTFRRASIVALHSQTSIQRIGTAHYIGKHFIFVKCYLFDQTLCEQDFFTLFFLWGIKGFYFFGRHSFAVMFEKQVLFLESLIFLIRSNTF